MTKKVKCILLIDDDEPTNFLHKIIINDSGRAEKVVAVHSGFEALEYLEKMEGGKYPQPELIFLDINMPAMNGWEFLEEYDQLDEGKKGKIVVVMLTTSINPDDKEKALSKGFINGFFNKPLTVEMIEKVIDENF
ncbi:response regulator [Cyclobacterium sp. 1_MG-2023]|uniref:Response regulator receiver protein n=1 Tax=Cyclobacterium marinum (strain ATCC 25205 / DSM 745 / LMG 13164 / NCIMB 1802) TaxID=880070 RepID=G0J6J8_CYCMS|nr:MULTISPECIES: response regulator [Cyclobacterium]AEL28513.1 response regulator receiver protein [Cyclobacterium marinum DSM 745]MBI0398361.1 response regulator [Cyclobacterium marinum]MBR9778016.1 response regulator [Cytophagales bacterium]MDO6436803.1 response regulator [Cyclobacterium sp. 1_MG-2023]|tara:strand:- start:149750 stop:150154 length:405 start_codon:yes stop_codon:yes gene_type:complete